MIIILQDMPLSKRLHVNHHCINMLEKQIVVIIQDYEFTSDRHFKKTQ